MSGFQTSYTPLLDELEKRKREAETELLELKRRKEDANRFGALASGPPRTPPQMLEDRLHAKFAGQFPTREEIARIIPDLAKKKYDVPEAPVDVNLPGMPTGAYKAGGDVLAGLIKLIDSGISGTKEDEEEYYQRLAKERGVGIPGYLLNRGKEAVLDLGKYAGKVLTSGGTPLIEKGAKPPQTFGGRVRSTIEGGAVPKHYLPLARVAARAVGTSPADYMDTSGLSPEEVGARNRSATNLEMAGWLFGPRAAAGAAKLAARPPKFRVVPKVGPKLQVPGPKQGRAAQAVSDIVGKTQKGRFTDIPAVVKGEGVSVEQAPSAIDELLMKLSDIKIPKKRPAAAPRPVKPVSPALGEVESAAADMGVSAAELREATIQGVRVAAGQEGKATPEMLYALTRAGLGGVAGERMADEDHKAEGAIAGALIGLGAHPWFKRAVAAVPKFRKYRAARRATPVEREARAVARARKEADLIGAPYRDFPITREAKLAKWNQERENLEQMNRTIPPILASPADEYKLRAWEEESLRRQPYEGWGAAQGEEIGKGLLRQTEDVGGLMEDVRVQGMAGDKIVIPKSFLAMDAMKGAGVDPAVVLGQKNKWRGFVEGEEGPPRAENTWSLNRKQAQNLYRNLASFREKLQKESKVVDETIKGIAPWTYKPAREWVSANKFYPGIDPSPNDYIPKLPADPLAKLLHKVRPKKETYEKPLTKERAESLGYRIADAFFEVSQPMATGSIETNKVFQKFMSGRGATEFTKMTWSNMAGEIIAGMKSSAVSDMSAAKEHLSPSLFKRWRQKHITSEVAARKSLGVGKKPTEDEDTAVAKLSAQLEKIAGRRGDTQIDQTNRYVFHAMTDESMVKHLEERDEWDLVYLIRTTQRMQEDFWALTWRNGKLDTFVDEYITHAFEGPHNHIRRLVAEMEKEFVMPPEGKVSLENVSVTSPSVLKRTMPTWEEFAAFANTKSTELGLDVVASENFLNTIPAYMESILQSVGGGHFVEGLRNIHDKATGLPVIWESTKPPPMGLGGEEGIPYVRVQNKRLRAWVHAVGDDGTAAYQEELWVHPDVEKVLKQYYEMDSKRPRAVKVLESILGMSKRLIMHNPFVHGNHMINNLTVGPGRLSIFEDPTGFLRAMVSLGEGFKFKNQAMRWGTPEAERAEFLMRGGYNLLEFDEMTRMVYKGVQDLLSDTLPVSARIARAGGLPARTLQAGKEVVRKSDEFLWENLVASTGFSLVNNWFRMFRSQRFSPEAAARMSGETTNSATGMLRPESMRKLTRDVSKWVLFARNWFLSNPRWGRGGLLGKYGQSPYFTAPERAAMSAEQLRGLGRGLFLLFGLPNIINAMNSGHTMNENPPGKKFKVCIYSDSHRSYYISIQAWMHDLMTWCGTGDLMNWYEQYKNDRPREPGTWKEERGIVKGLADKTSGFVRMWPSALFNVDADAGQFHENTPERIGGAMSAFLPSGYGPLFTKFPSEWRGTWPWRGIPGIGDPDADYRGYLMAPPLWQLGGFHISTSPHYSIPQPIERYKRHKRLGPSWPEDRSLWDRARRGYGNILEWMEDKPFVFGLERHDAEDDK